MKLDSDEGYAVCYRTACSNTANVYGYNQVTGGLYCIPCARMIDSAARVDGLDLYPLLAAYQGPLAASYSGLAQGAFGLRRGQLRGLE